MAGAAFCRGRPNCLYGTILNAAFTLLDADDQSLLRQAQQHFQTWPQHVLAHPDSYFQGVRTMSLLVADLRMILLAPVFSTAACATMLRQLGGQESFGEWALVQLVS